MRRIIRSDLMEEFEIFEHHEAKPGEGCMHFDDRFFTRQFLSGFLNDYFAMNTFRTILYEGMDHFDLTRMDDHQVLEAIADKLISGKLKMVDREGWMTPSGILLGSWDHAARPRQQEQPAEVKEAEPEEEPEKTNISVALQHDITLPEAQDDKVVLFSSDDDGGTYKQEVTLRQGGEQFADDGNGHLRVLFKELPLDIKCSCHLDLGKDARGNSAGVFVLLRHTSFSSWEHVDDL